MGPGRPPSRYASHRPQAPTAAVAMYAPSPFTPLTGCWPCRIVTHGRATPATMVAAPAATPSVPVATRTRSVEGTASAAGSGGVLTAPHYAQGARQTSAL